MVVRRKLAEISFFEVILCFFVVMIHLLSESISVYEKGSLLSVISFSFSRVMTFAVPGFVMSAGIKFAHKFEYTSFNYFSFIKGRIAKIYLPYLFFAVLYYLYFVFIRKYFFFDFSDLFQYLIHGSIAAPFYFVIVMMQIYFLAPLWLFLYKSFPASIGLAISAVITLLSLFFIKGFSYSDRIFTHYMLYWLMGCYIGSDFRNIIRKLSQKRILLLVLGIIFTIMYVSSSYLQFCQVYYTFFTEVIKVFYCVFVSLLYLSFMPKSLGIISENIASATFYVYLMHCLVIFEIQAILDKAQILSVPTRFIIASIVTYFVTLFLSVGYANLKKMILSKKRGKFF